MTKFVRSANEGDLREGTKLLYGDDEIWIGQELEPGYFSVMLPDKTVAEISKYQIERFQVEIAPLTVVK